MVVPAAAEEIRWRIPPLAYIMQALVGRADWRNDDGRGGAAAGALTTPAFTWRPRTAESKRAGQRREDPTERARRKPACMG